MTRESIEKSIERLQGCAIPIAILAYDVEHDQFRVCILDDVNAEEAAALLRKLSLEIILP